MPPKEPPPITYSGHCMCGKVGWETKQPKDTVEVGMCYCDTCQRSTGAERSAFLVIEKRTFSFIKKGPTAKFRVRGTQLRDERSPNSTFYKDFIGCSDCRSPLLWDNEWSNGRFHVLLGTLEKDQKEALDKIQFLTYASNKLPITIIADSLDKITKGGGRVEPYERQVRPAPVK